jgi:hypothetical protein
MTRIELDKSQLIELRTVFFLKELRVNIFDGIIIVNKKSKDERN